VYQPKRGTHGLTADGESRRPEFGIHTVNAAPVSCFRIVVPLPCNCKRFVTVATNPGRSSHSVAPKHLRRQRFGYRAAFILTSIFDTTTVPRRLEGGGAEVVECTRPRRDAIGPLQANLDSTTAAHDRRPLFESHLSALTRGVH
jgi:hypothetical protein